MVYEGHLDGLGGDRGRRGGVGARRGAVCHRASERRAGVEGRGLDKVNWGIGRVGVRSGGDGCAVARRAVGCVLLARRPPRESAQEQDDAEAQIEELRPRPRDDGVPRRRPRWLRGPGHVAKWLRAHGITAGLSEQREWPVRDDVSRSRLPARIAIRVRRGRGEAVNEDMVRVLREQPPKFGIVADDPARVRHVDKTFGGHCWVLKSRWI